MYNWYKWQCEHLGVPEIPEPTNSYGQEFIALNLFEETQCFRDWIKSGCCAGTEQSCIASEGYIKDLARDYGVPYEQLKQWYDDPLYDRLTNQAGRYEDVPIPSDLLKHFQQKVGDLLHIDWESAHYTFSIQRPGDMFPIHRDRTKSSDFGLTDLEPSLTRYLILIENQKPGQVFLMEDQPVSWRAGDVINWPHHYFQYHGSANFGYWPKYTLRITAQKSKCEQVTSDQSVENSHAI